MLYHSGCKEIAAAWRCLQNMYRDFAPRDEFRFLADSKGKIAADLPMTERAVSQFLSVSGEVAKNKSNLHRAKQYCPPVPSCMSFWRSRYAP